MQSGVPQGGGKEHRSLSAAELADELQRLQSEQAAAAAMQLQQQDEARVLASGLVMQLQVGNKPESDPWEPEGTAS